MEFGENETFIVFSVTQPKIWTVKPVKFLYGKSTKNHIFRQFLVSSAVKLKFVFLLQFF